MAAADMLLLLLLTAACGCTGLLVGIPAFRAAPIEFLQQLVGLMEVASYSKEDLVVLQGDPGGTLYFVAEGKLEVCVGGAGTDTDTDTDTGTDYGSGTGVCLGFLLCRLW
jgi:hypothetical protein